MGMASTPNSAGTGLSQGFEVASVSPGDAVLVRGFHPVHLVVVQREGEDVESALAALLDHGLQGRHFRAARAVPGRPELDQHDRVLASESSRREVMPRPSGLAPLWYFPTMRPRPLDEPPCRPIRLRLPRSRPRAERRLLPSTQARCTGPRRRLNLTTTAIPTATGRTRKAATTGACAPTWVRRCGRAMPTPGRLGRGRSGVLLRTGQSVGGRGTRPDGRVRRARWRPPVLQAMGGAQGAGLRPGGAVQQDLAEGRRGQAGAVPGSRRAGVLDIGRIRETAGPDDGISNELDGRLRTDPGIAERRLCQRSTRARAFGVPRQLPLSRHGDRQNPARLHRIRTVAQGSRGAGQGGRRGGQGSRGAEAKAAEARAKAADAEAKTAEAQAKAAEDRIAELEEVLRRSRRT